MIEISHGETKDKPIGKGKKSARATADLQQLKGVGGVLAQRMVGAGITSYDDILQAGEEGLRNIAGIRPQVLPSILDQAKVLAEHKKAAKAERIEALRTRIRAVKDQVEKVDQVTRERFGEKLEGKYGGKVTGDLQGLLEELGHLDTGVLKRLKRVGRGLDKVERRVDGLQEAGLRKIRRGLKKSRKALHKALLQ